MDAVVLEIFSEMTNDPFLNEDLGEVVEHILSVAGTVVLCFNIYKEYPARLVLMSTKWNSSKWQLEALAFLRCDEQELDQGLSLSLYHKAWSHGSERHALTFLGSAEAQELIFSLCELGDASTLDIERKHALDKRAEQ